MKRLRRVPIHFKVTDFDLQKSGDAGLLGRLLEMTMNVTRANLPITMRVKVASFASLAQPCVNDLRLDEIVIEDGRVRIVRAS